MRAPERHEVVVPRHDVTLVLVGDSRVGKSALATRFRTGKFEASGVRAAGGERGVTSAVLEGRRVRYTIQEPRHQDRELVYREADVFLLCYRISDPSSLFSAINHWVPELRQHAPATPLLLIGTASDLRADRSVVDSLARRGQGFVSSEQARSLGQQVGALAALETSARRSLQEVQAVFHLAARLSLDSCSSPPHTLERTNAHWDQLSNSSASSSHSFPRSSSLASSLDSTRSSLSLPRSSSSPLTTRRTSLTLRKVARPDKPVTIRVQRLTVDKVYEEVEIEVPATVYESMQACSSSGAREEGREGREGRATLASRLKALFHRA